MPKQASSPDGKSSRTGPYRSSRASRARPDGCATGSSQGSFFQSSNNVDISGGNFSIARGHHTNLTININQVGQDDSESESQRPTGGRPDSEMAYYGQDVEISQVDDRRSEQTWRSQALPVQKSCDIYYRHLAVKGRGSPLWIPEPNDELPIAYRRRGIFIGDVGIITASGSFDFLFNICVPRDDPINPEGLPEDFFPLHPPLRPIDLRGQSEFMPNSYLASASIQRLQYDGALSSGLMFGCSASEGAILTMPNGAYSKDLTNIARFRKHLSANVEKWYRYINGDLGREAKNGDIRLVIGCDKTNAWGMATFSNLTEHQDLQLKFRSTGESPVGPTYGWEYSGMAEVRVGPSHHEVAELGIPAEGRSDRDRHKNQCLFVRTLNATLRDDVWDRLSSELDMEAAYTPSSPNANFGRPSTTNSTSGSQFRDSTSFYSGDSSGNHRTSSSGHVKSLKKIAQRVQTSKLTTGLTAHPSNEVNAIILEMFKNQFPEARMVITEDADWMSGLREGDSMMPSASNLLARVSSELEVCEDEGVLCFREKYPIHIALTASAPPSSMLSLGGTKDNNAASPLSLSNRIAGRGKPVWSSSSGRGAAGLKGESSMASASMSGWAESNASTSATSIEGDKAEDMTDPQTTEEEEEESDDDDDDESNHEDVPTPFQGETERGGGVSNQRQRTPSHHRVREQSPFSW